MHNRQNWDDLRYVLAVARTGSVTAAGKQLSVNHATVLRRVAAFEEAFGLTLFEKTVRGYRVTPGNQAVLDALSEAEDAILGVARAASGISAPLLGTVRVTSTDTLCTTILPKVADHVAPQAPGLRFELISSNVHLNFARLDADLTVRPAVRLPEDLEGDQVAELGFGVYEPRDVTRENWIGLAGPLSRAGPGEWIAQNVPDEKIAASADSFVTARELIAQGRGRGVVPDILCRNDPRLRRCDDIAPPSPVPIWVAGHRDMRDVPRLRAARDLLCSEIAAYADELAGRA